MKTELHCHTGRYSHTAVDDPNQMGTPKQIMESLIAAGYEAVYLTEHDAIWPSEEIAALQDHFPEIKIFPGIEKVVGEKNQYHVVALGTNDPEYTRLQHEGQLVHRAREQGHLTILAHPWMYEPEMEHLWRGPLPDAMESMSNKGKGSFTATMQWGIQLQTANAQHIDLSVPESASYVRFTCLGAGETFAWTQPFFPASLMKSGG